MVCVQKKRTAHIATLMLEAASLFSRRKNKK
jgi:hypothetical protein